MCVVDGQRETQMGVPCLYVCVRKRERKKERESMVYMWSMEERTLCEGIVNLSFSSSLTFSLSLSQTQ